MNTQKLCKYAKELAQTLFPGFTDISRVSLLPWTAAWEREKRKRQPVPENSVKDEVQYEVYTMHGMSFGLAYSEKLDELIIVELES